MKEILCVFSIILLLYAASFLSLESMGAILLIPTVLIAGMRASWTYKQNKWNGIVQKVTPIICCVMISFTSSLIYFGTRWKVLAQISFVNYILACFLQFFVFDYFRYKKTLQENGKKE